MIVIIGASASGKTEVSKVLEREYGYKKCVTTTTRPLRLNEINHIDYHFISKKEFLEEVELNQFVEYAIYNNNYYGINKKDINTNALVVVEPNGANELIKQLGNKAYIVYIETKEDIRKERMIKRLDDLEIVNQRIFNDKIVFVRSSLDRIDLLVENNNHNINEVAKYIQDEYIKHLTKI